MSLELFYATFTTLVLWTCLGPSLGWPVLPENTTLLPIRKLFKSSALASVADIANHRNAINGGGGLRSTDLDGSSSSGPIGVHFHRLPPSPANLLKPDGFQFYAYNERGDMITKQMTVEEIQALIAGGGPDHSNTEVQEPQKAEDILTGGKKVMDVVEKVQSVLKSAMGKPASTLTASIPSIPEKENAEWSNILAAILGGDKYADKLEDSPITGQVTGKPIYQSVAHTDPYSDSLKPHTVENAGVSLELSEKSTADSLERNEESMIDDRRNGNETQQALSTVIVEAVTNSYTEKFMIPVSVITTEQTAQTAQIFQNPTESSVLPKITQALANNSSDQYLNHDEKTNPIATNFNEHSTTSNSSSSLSFESTEISFGSVELTSTTLRSIIEQDTVRSPTAETKTEPPEDISIIEDKNHRPTSDQPFETKATTALSSNQVQTMLVDASSTTTPSPSLTSAIFATSTDQEFDAALLTESSTIPATKPADFQSTQSFKPFPMELVNSLSSMINQVSEAVPSVLPVSSSGFESNDRETDQQKLENDFQVWPGTASIINATKFQEESDRANATEYTKVDESPVETTTKLDIDIDHDHDHDQTILSTASSVSFASAGTVHRKETTTSVLNVSMEPELTQSYVPNLHQLLRNSTKSTVTTNGTLHGVTVPTASFDQSPINDLMLTLQAIDKPTTTYNLTDSPNTNSTEIDSNSSSKIGEIQQRPNAETVAIVENILQGVSFSTEANNAPVPETLLLPDILPENVPTKTLASGLIAGFGSDASNPMNNAFHETTTFFPRTLPSTNVTAPPSSLQVQESTSSLSIIAETQTEEHAFDTEEEDVTTNENENENDTDVTSMPSDSLFGDLPQLPMTHNKEPIALETANRTVPHNLYTESENKSSIVSTKYTSTMIVTTESSALDVPVNNIVPYRSNNSIGNDNTFPNYTVNPIYDPTTSSRNESSTMSVGGEHVDIQSNSQEVEAEKDTLKMKSPEVLVVEDKTVGTRPEGVAQESLKKVDTKVAWTGQDDSSTETSLADRINENTTILRDDDSSTNANANANANANEYPTRVELSNSVIMRTEDSPKEMAEQQTISNFHVINSTTAFPVREFGTSGKESTVTTNVPWVLLKNEGKLPAIETIGEQTMTKLSKDKVIANASNSVGFQGARNKTNSPNESVAVTMKIREEPSEPHLDSAKRVNGSTEADFEEKWQRISLHQTAPFSSTKYVAVTRNPEVSESTTMTTMTTMTSTTMPEVKRTEEEETRYQSSTPMIEAESTVTLDPSKGINGLDSSTKNASIDIVNFSRLCNELALKFWIAANKGLSSGRSLALSPFGMISLLAMVYLGARGSTSDQMNEVLGLDNVATFNPHLIFQNVTDAVSLARHQGIANAAFVRELFADKAKVRKLMPFYKEQAQQFYEGLVTEVNFATISDLARRRTNLLIRKQTGGRIKDFVRSNAVPLRSPLAAISANVFQTDCNTSLASTRGRDGELYFAVSSAHRLRKLIPVPATVWRSNVLAGYEPSLDATAVALGGLGKLVSTIFLLPGQQGHAAPGDTLDRLEQRIFQQKAFIDGSWKKLLKVLIPRVGLELQIPKFSHRSIVNATAALKRMGLDRLFSSDADFRGINGIGNRLFLSDVLQMNLFSTCGDENIGNGRHHVEIYPASPSWRSSRREQSSDGTDRTAPFYSVKSYRTTSIGGISRNSERTEDKPRLKLDQPFLYFVRHNPTDLILHMGRFNPRLL